MDDSYFNRKKYLKQKIKDIDIRLHRINNILHKSSQLNTGTPYIRDVRERDIMDIARMTKIMKELKASLLQTRKFYQNCISFLID